MKEISAILSSDWHLRETQPSCRTDDFWEAQWKKVQYVSKLASQYGCPVIHAGDLFEHWKPSPNLIRMCIKHLPVQFYSIYGQHDLPNHSLKLKEKSGIAALEEARRVVVLRGCHWNEIPDKPSLEIEGRKILVWHHMVWQGKKLWPNQTDPNAAAVLRKYPEYDLILTGDNHKPFTEEYEGKILVNPGSLSRQNADQIDHKPRVYLYNAADNSVTIHYIPIDPDVVSRSHIDREEERDGRIQAYVEKLNQDWSVDLSFERNLEEFFRKNKVRTSVKELIYKAIEQ